MNEQWLGRTVSLNCGPLGFFQGAIKGIKLEDQTIILEKVFHNGMPSKTSTVTIRGQDVKELSFLENSPAEKEPTVKSVHSTVKVIKKKPKSEEFAASSNGKKLHSPPVALSTENCRLSPKKAFQEPPRTPNKKSILRQRDEDCFGAEVVQFTEDFDFEKNLALFDKQLVFEQIESASVNQPDVVRLVDYNKRKTSPSVPEARSWSPPPITEPKYRNDQNVLESTPVEYLRIFTGQEVHGEMFSTDQGLMVPAVSLSLRDRLMSAAEARGFCKERIIELMARCTTELSIQLLGGERRLNPLNQHQVPSVVVLCGPGRSGCYGLASARHLASHGVRTVAFLPGLELYPASIQTELNLYKLCCKGAQKGNHIYTCDVSELPSSVDLVIHALDDHEMWEQEQRQAWHKKAVHWAADCRAPVLAIDPVQRPSGLIFKSKAAIMPGLPLWHPHNSVGKTYLVNLGLPAKVYKDVGISFVSPFGPKTYVALHSAN